LIALPDKFFGGFALGDVADVALNDLLVAFLVEVADKLHVPALSIFGLKRQVFVADITLLLQLFKGLRAGF